MTTSTATPATLAPFWRPWWSLGLLPRRHPLFNFSVKLLGEQTFTEFSKIKRTGCLALKNCTFRAGCVVPWHSVKYNYWNVPHTVNRHCYIRCEQHITPTRMLCQFVITPRSFNSFSSTYLVSSNLSRSSWTPWKASLNDFAICWRRTGTGH